MNRRGLLHGPSTRSRGEESSWSCLAIIEVHYNPEKALSYGPQSLYSDQFDRQMGELRIIAPVLGGTLPLARG